MFDLLTILWLSIGVIAGIATGLIPAINMALPLMFLVPFIDSISVTNIFVYWMAVIIGAQFFGSVAALSANVPGEGSSLVYLDHIAPLGVNDRVTLIKLTAIGSAFASIIACLLMMGMIYFGSIDLLYLANKISVKSVIFIFVIVGLVTATNHRFIALVTFVIGLLLSIKNNYSLPPIFLHIQELTNGLTFFAIIASLYVFPNILNFRDHSSNSAVTMPDNQISTSLPWGTLFRGSVVGSFLGIVPGANATISSMMASNLESDIKNKVVSAETANNSATIVGMIPLLLLGIPITLHEVLLLQLFQLKLVSWPPLELSELPTTIIAILTLGIVITIIYTILSTNFLTFYSKILRLLNSKVGQLVLAVVLIGIAILDWSNSVLSVTSYLLYFAGLLAFGTYLHKKDTSVLPIIFGFLLGDQIVWVLGQILSIYF